MIRQLHHLQDDLLDRLIRVSRFALANEVGVFRDQAGIQHQRDIQRRDQLLHLAQIGHRKRLTADQVGGRFHAHKGNLVGAMLVDRGLQAAKVHIALEGIAALGIERSRPE